MVIADIFLAIGAHISNTGLMLFWLVVMMINIVLLFIGLFFAIIVATVGAAWLGISQNACSDISNALAELGQESGLSGSTNCDNDAGVFRLCQQISICFRGHSKTTLTIFCPILTTYLPPVDMLTK